MTAVVTLHGTKVASTAVFRLRIQATSTIGIPHPSRYHSANPPGTEGLLAPRIEVPNPEVTPQGNDTVDSSDRLPRWSDRMSGQFFHVFACPCDVCRPICRSSTTQRPFIQDACGPSCAFAASCKAIARRVIFPTMRAYYLVFYIAMPLSGALAYRQAPSQQSSTSDASKPEAVSPVHQMFLDDQNDMHNMLADKQINDPAHKQMLTDEYNERDADRRARIRELLARGELQQAQDFHDAAYLFQHGETADDYLVAHVLAIDAVIRGDSTSKWIAAATLDRYLQLTGKPQVFGTQYPFDPSVARKSDGTENTFQGRTQEPFNDQFVPDALRLDFCVPGREQQKKNVETLNAGKYPAEAMVAPGCKR